MDMKNARGFNTIEMLITVGILALVAAAAATLSQVANNSTSYADSKLEAQALGNLFIEHLKNAETCKDAIGADSTLANRVRGGTGDIVNPYATAAHIRIRIPGLQAGSAMDGTVINPDGPIPARQIIPRKLQINGLRLAEGLLVDTTPTTFTYITNVHLDASPIEGTPLRPMHIGTINVTTDRTTGTIDTCQGQPPSVADAICRQMGCTFNSALTPPCQCEVSLQYCYPVSRYPIRFENGRPECTQLGAGVPCASGQYLTEVSLGHQVCAPVTTVCPTGTSTTGAGGSIPGLIGCKCPYAGQTYLASGVCDPPPTDCVGRWGSCSVSCGGGTQTYNITTAATSGGAACPFADGATRNCNTQACGTAVTGACGSANGAAFADQTAFNSAQHCSAGNRSSVTGTWQWTCNGINGGANSPQCSASQGASPPPPAQCQYPFLMVSNTTWCCAGLPPDWAAGEDCETTCQLTRPNDGLGGTAACNQ